MSKWENTALKKLGYTYVGLSGKTSADFGEGLPYIPYMNVFSNATVNPRFLEYVKVEKYEKQNRVQIGDILFTTSSETPEEVGMSSVLAQDCGELYLNSFCFGYKLNDKEMFDNTFLAHLFRGKNVRHQMFIAAQGSTRYNLSKKNFNGVTINYPIEIVEQCKIAEVLSTVDEAIEKTIAIVGKFTAIKDGLMQDLLGKGDTDSVIGKVAKIIMGQSPDSHYVSDTPSNGIPFLQGNAEFGYEHPVNLLWCRQPCKIASESSLLVSVRAPVGSINIANQHFCIGRGLCSIEFEKIDKRFGYYLFQTLVPALNLKSQGSTFLAVNKKDVLELKIIYPYQIKQQKEIADQLTATDEKIENERKYLAKLQDIKKGLMQDLLTNKVSVKALFREEAI